RGIPGCGDGRAGARPGGEAIEHERPQGRVGDILRRDGADSRPRMGAARRYRRRRRRNRNTELAALIAAGNDREGHGSSRALRATAYALRIAAQSGMTAVASISTSHSGRARQVTTTPVETGWIPFMYSPIVRYTASRWRTSV